MAEFTWNDVELPILEAIRHAEIDGADPVVRAAHVAPHLSPQQFAGVRADLQGARYIEANVHRAFGREVVRVTGVRLIEKGRKAIGSGPETPLTSSSMHWIA